MDPCAGIGAARCIKQQILTRTFTIQSSRGTLCTMHVHWNAAAFLDGKATCRPVLSRAVKVSIKAREISWQAKW
jgi:hypothetical protein